MTLVLGVYGSVNLRLGPNSSILVQPNALFVQSLKVCYNFTFTCYLTMIDDLARF